MNQHPRIIAHRGYTERYPENTLAALKAAIDAGADAVELDVQLCRDGTPVVFHDATLDRVSGEPGVVLELGFDELQAFSVHEPERLGEAFKGTRIPSLASAVQLLAESDTGALVFVEIKRDTVPYHTIPQAVETILDICEPLGERAVIISFDADVVQEARSLGEIRVGWVLSDWTMASQDRLETLQPDFAFVDIDVVPPIPAPLWEGPWEWVVYEINDWSQAANLARHGFKWIETQAVEALVRGKQER
ncbi:MAG TPA: glycerophosphodiester phosphodiesterase family protein [Gammaproteobacteria bacterium]|nr:glycerophosphodiester phosphodiesterase family protein [Gammaproteobacteria bacterium]